MTGATLKRSILALCQQRGEEDSTLLAEQLSELSNYLTTALQVNLAPKARLQQFLDIFYDDLLFGLPKESLFDPKYYTFSYVIAYRTGSPLMLAIIATILAAEQNIDLWIKQVEGQTYILYRQNHSHTLLIDPISGNRICWNELFTKKDTAIEESLQSLVHDEMSCDDIAQCWMEQMKSAYIADEQFAKALDLSNTLVEISPNDPYERRDRGYLLHQLDCRYVAIEDYKYFIEHCPDDPAAKLLKTQLPKMEEQNIRFH